MYPLSVTAGNQSLKLPLNEKNKSRAACMADPSAYNYTTDIFTERPSGGCATARCRRARSSCTCRTRCLTPAGGAARRKARAGRPVPTDLTYADKAWPEVERDHAASVSVSVAGLELAARAGVPVKQLTRRLCRWQYLDGRVGDLLDALDTLEYANRTVVFFASDNGAHNEGGHNVRFFNSTAGLRGFKRSFYEGGIRSPSSSDGRASPARAPSRRCRGHSGACRPRAVSSSPWTPPPSSYACGVSAGGRRRHRPPPHHPATPPAGMCCLQCSTLRGPAAGRQHLRRPLDRPRPPRRGQPPPTICIGRGAAKSRRTPPHPSTRASRRG